VETTVKTIVKPVVKTTGKDQIYAQPQVEVAGFRFDSAVADVFPDMIKRSVPGYETIIAMTGTLAEQYVQPQSRCYDLGCSLGASTLAMRHQIQHEGCEIIGVDNSEAMLQRCRQVLDRDHSVTPVSLICGNIQDIAITNASMVVLNFTLQFIPLAERQALISRIAEGLRPGGILVLSEKVCFTNAQHNQLMIDLHHHFKRAQGYSELEISQKRSSLENVLIPETLDQHRERLSSAGFGSVDVWFQCFNFASLIAIKNSPKEDAS
jgi:tRNA (cmo5U34)-methyltransferase